MWFGDKTVQQTVDLSRHEVGKIRRHENSAFRPMSAVEDDARAPCIQIGLLVSQFLSFPSFSVRRRWGTKGSFWLLSGRGYGD